jgi:hypothetical protein
MRIPRALLGIGVFAACLGMQPREARGVILIEVFELFTLVEIVGLEFALYSSSERASIRVEDTQDGFMGGVELRGQTERRSDLSFFAVSISDPRQQIHLEIDIRPLIGPPREGLTFLQSNPMPIEPLPVTDRALEPFAEPLLFGFEFIREIPDPGTGGTRAEYRLARIDQVPEPASWLLLAAGGCFLTKIWRRAKIVGTVPMFRS